MPDLLAGSIIRALDTPPTVSDAEPGSYTCSSASYTTATTGGTYADCAVVFTAPTTGRVRIDVAARLDNSTTSITAVAAQTRTGSVINSGTVIETADTDSGVHGQGTDDYRQGASHVLSGLTPGDVYNTILLHKAVSGSTGTVSERELIVAPLT